MIFQLLTQLEKESRGQFNKRFTRVKVFLIKLTPDAPIRSRTYELLSTSPNALPVISHKRLLEAKDNIILKYSPGFKFTITFPSLCKSTVLPRISARGTYSGTIAESDTQTLLVSSRNAQRWGGGGGEPLLDDTKNGCVAD